MLPRSLHCFLNLFITLGGRVAGRDTCFVHSYAAMQKLVRIAMEKRQNSLRVDHATAFILP